MPHTSRKKKQPPKKRREILDEDGWTHVTSQAAPPWPLEPFAAQMSTQGYEAYTLKLGKGGEDEDEDKGEDCITLWPITPSLAEPSMTDEKLLERYRSVEKSWMASESCHALTNTLRAQALTAVGPVRTCVCLGTGSFSGLRDGWIARHEVALYQLAAFKTVINTMEQSHGQKPAAFAQEPNYNEFDSRLLAALGITKVDHPAAFCLLTSHSFVFCPGAEQFVLLRALLYNPAMYLGGRLELYQGKDGRTYSKALACAIQTGPQSDLLELSEAEECDLPPFRAMLKSMREEKHENSRTIAAFVQHKECVRLPNLDVKDFPFHEMHLYWRRRNAQETAIPWPTPPIF